MRKREEILEEFIDMREDIHSPINSNLRPILEVLLDIRDLLYSILNIKNIRVRVEEERR